MPTSHPDSVMNLMVLIDADFLLQKVHSLRQVQQGHLTWNEFGEKIARSVPGNYRRYHDHDPERAPAPGPTVWLSAKELVHAAMISQDLKYEQVRKRLIYFERPSTPSLFTTLSLWLAGKLGISVTTTQPMVAAMLYGVGQSDGNWGILVDC